MRLIPTVAGFLLIGLGVLPLAAPWAGHAQAQPAGPGVPPPPPTAPTATTPAYGTAPQPTSTAGQPPGTAPAPSSTNPYGQPVTAGGLEAPPPMDPPADDNKSDTEKALDEAEEEDSERGPYWFYLDVEGGYQYVGLETFNVSEEHLTVGFESSDASGGFIGAGLGVQLLIITIGPRGRIGFFEEWQMYSLNGEIGIRIPISIFEPHLNLGAGYTALGSLSGQFHDEADSVHISGFNVRVGGGLDFFPIENLSLGAAFTWEFMGLTRPGVSAEDVQKAEAAGVEEAKAQALAAEGSGYGTVVTIGGRIGIHF